MRDVLEALGLVGCHFALAKKVPCVPCMGALCICKGTGKRFIPKVFEDASEAETWLENAEDAWITGNPIKAGIVGRPNADDVAEWWWLLLDADPEKTAEDPEGLSEASRNSAHALAEEAHEALRGQGILVDSGRGAQLWIRVARDVPRRLLLRYIASSLARPGVKVDATHDPSRLMRLPGSVNSRTGRVATLLAPCEEGEPLSREEVEGLLEGFIDVGIEEVHAAESFDSSPPTPSDSSWLRGDAMVHWSAEADTDRSLRDFVFLRILLKENCPERVACRLLFALPGGKAQEDKRNARYWGSTLESVYKTLAEEAARRDRLSSLVSEARDDPSAVFQAQALEDLAWIQRWDEPGWQGLRADFKGLRSFRISDLEKSMGRVAARTQGPPDNVARCVARNGDEAYWLVRAEVDGGWIKASHATVQAVLRASGESADVARKAASAKPWVIDSVPFAPVWLDGRRLNTSKAQWCVEPSPGDYPMWEQLLTVVGRGLDESVVQNAWCKANRLPDGGCYLFAWLASIAQYPGKSTAYLFCFSERENLGKSMFTEAIRRHLMSGGIVKADRALLSERGFNAELDGAVICVVEEANLGRNRNRAHDRMKDLITGDAIGLEKKGIDVQDVTNYTHWYQTANSASFCPLFKGDTRITAWEMQPPKAAERIEKADMHPLLGLEAPAFLHALLSFDLPKSGDGRLAVPAVGTDAKAWQQEASRSLIDVWLEKRPDWVALDSNDVVSAAQRWLSLQGEDLRYWRRATILRSLPADAVTVRLRAAAKAFRALTVPVRASAVTVQQLTGWGTAESIGRAVAALEKRGVKWVRHGRSNGKRFVAIDSPSTTKSAGSAG